MRVVILHPHTKYEVRRPCRSEDMATMCVSINGPGDLDLRPFDFETGMRVASKVGKHSFRIWARWAFGFANYSQYTRRTDRHKQCLLLPFPADGGIIICVCVATDLDHVIW